MATFAGNPAATSLTGAEIVPITQGGVDKRTTVGEIADALAITLDPALIPFSHSGFTADNVEDAIIEAANTAGAPTAAEVSYDNGTSGLTATDVQAAIDEIAAAGGSDNLTIVTEASAFTADPATHSGRSKLILAGGDVTIDSAETYVSGNVFNIRATAAIELLEDGVTLTPPAGGTLELDADMAVTIAMTGSTTGVVIGQTVAA